MPVKRLIDARRRRKNPPRGFGWIDHRLLRDGYLGRCSTESLALYVLLVCASDAQGLRRGLNIKTVRKWLDKARYEARSKAARRPSKLDPYKDLIVCWLEKHPYSALQILQRLRTEHGYSGGRSILQEFIATVRPVREKAFLKLAFEAGDCLQIDWGYSWADAHRGSFTQAPLLRGGLVL
jgi:hypothetical protein